MVLRDLAKGGVIVKKMNIEYVDLELVDEGGRGFGLLVRCPSGENFLLHSVCIDRNDAEYIAKTVNRLGVSECHVYDVIEDLLP